MSSGANHGGGDQKGTAMSTATAWPDDRRITIRDLQAATDRGERWSMLTSYDTLTAGVFEQAGVRAHRDDSLRPDVTALDVTWLIEQFSRRPPDPVDPDEERNVRARLVAIALDGLRAQPGPRTRENLPGRPPSRARYVGRWSRGSLA
jgi:hypothetical protein